MISTDLELDLSSLTDLEFDIQCEVHNLQGDYCESPAHWAALFTCGCSVLYCDEHLTKKRERQANLGFLKCTKAHPGTEIKIILVDPISTHL